MRNVSRTIQNILIAFIMGTSIMGIYNGISVAWIKTSFYHIPVLFIIIFIASLFIADDVRNSFKKVLWYNKREDKLPIWQVGIGMLFYFTQVGFVEVFMRTWMEHALAGMPMYLVISFLNSFLFTVIFQEIFYFDKKSMSQPGRFRKDME